ncbi:CD209 antigen-like protein A [Conger conger]|uniref:CD209 antigen-like protein A n=1 Tax=Conger conger TaxID=82655 RepID=UPI002A5989A6|nr:CD209 antigen-like protein A [Conger conger]
MAESTVSKDMGIYAELTSPHHDVYCTVGQTTPNSPRAQHTETVGRSSHPYRLAAVCLGLLCALLLAATIVLCVLYTRLSKNNSMLEREQLDFTEEIGDNGSGDSECPQGWEQFYSKCYYFSTERKSWKDSRRDCLRRGADLVIIESDEEQEFITNSTFQRAFNWIRLSDWGTESTWLWVGEPLLRRRFFLGYPYALDCAQTPVNRLAAHLCAQDWGWICETNALLA